MLEKYLHPDDPKHGYIIYGDDYALHRIRQDGGSPTVHIDGTFSVTPPFFNQDLVVIIRCRGLALSVFHVLMTSRKQSLYTAVFKRLKDLLGPTVTIKHVKAGKFTEGKRSKGQ